MSKEKTRDAILDAAENMLIRRGLIKTTLEAIAAEAGISKGGVLHYFPSKKSLLMAILARFEEFYFTRREEIYQSLPDTPCRLARATLMGIIETRTRYGDAANYRIDTLEDADFRNRIGRMKTRLHEDLLSRARHPEKVLLAMYMMDGIWMHKQLNPPPVPGNILAKSREWLSEYIENMYNDYE